MAVTVITPASSKQLTTVARVKDDLGISGSTDDTVLGRMIDRASRRIVSYCNREFAQETISETVKAYGGHNLLMSRAPIVSVTSIAYDGTTIPATDYELAEPGAGLIYSPYGWQDTAQRYNGASLIPATESRRNLYTVVYVAGYILPSMVGTVDLPADIEEACIELTRAFFSGRKTDPGIQSEQVPDVYSVTYRDTSGGDGMPSQIADLLAPYRRITL